MTNLWQGTIEQIAPCQWRIPKSYKPGMLEDVIVFTNEAGLIAAKEGEALEQLANTAFLPGITSFALAMPDIHAGYGFPIGGVGATDLKTGVISPGGIGFDINCGVRLVKTNLELSDVKSKIKTLIDRLYREIPSGVGSKGKLKLGNRELKAVLQNGARWAVEQGYGFSSDLEFSEEGGAMAEADPASVSERAMARGIPQLGTMGSGNHFLELQVVEAVVDQKIAKVFGLYEGQVVLMIHTGSRGLGHQVCTDYLATMNQAVKNYKLELPDRQLACAPLNSREGETYFAAMAAAANFAWANRQCITHWSREVFAQEFKSSPEKLGMELLYDVCHNIAKFETHLVEGKARELCVHRKGATRAFGPGRKEIPAKYRQVGQPVIVPGDMGRNSWILAGTETAMELTFGSTCHGAGRVMSRKEALRQQTAGQVQSALAKKGIYARAASRGALAEEAPEAYKNVNEIVEICQRAGISKQVAKLRPLGVVKG